MKTIVTILLIGFTLFPCTGQTAAVKIEGEPNISKDFLSEFEWLNSPKSFDIVDDVLQVTVVKGTDFFNDPEEKAVTASAPLLYKAIKGDFVVKALVQPDFGAQWNAVALMVYKDNLKWVKFAFENSDATGPGIVSVVTKGSSDDANGAVIPDRKKLWLAIARKGDIFSMHWSIDGKNYRMARLTAMPSMDEIKIGVEFQSPVGEEAKHFLHFFEVEKRTVKNLRDLNEK